MKNLHPSLKKVFPSFPANSLSKLRLCQASPPPFPKIWQEAQSPSRKGVRVAHESETRYQPDFKSLKPNINQKRKIEEVETNLQPEKLLLCV